MDWQYIKAGYLFDHLSAYLAHLRNEFISASNNSFFLSFQFLLSLIVFITLLYLIRFLYILIRSIKEESILLELTPPSSTDKTAFTTAKLFAVIHELGKHKTLTDKLIGKKTVFSFEIVSTLQQGIRYLVRTSPDEANNLRRSILSYLPQVTVKTVNEYLPLNIDRISGFNTKITEFKLSKHFAYPLQRQDTLEEHDPVAYITGMMTKLSLGELVSFQVVISPTYIKETNAIVRKILNNEDVLTYLDSFRFPKYLQIVGLILSAILKIVHFVIGELCWVIQELRHGDLVTTFSGSITSNKQIRIYNTFEQQAIKGVQDKINQPLFETSIRVLICVKDKKELKERTKGFISSLATFSVLKYQSLKFKYNYLPLLLNKIRLWNFNKRRLSLIFNQSSTLLSISEISNLYHFPFKRVTQTENIVKAYSKELPAPLSLKQDKKLDVIFGKNSFGGVTTDIGLSEEERKTHMYILGRTGSGKTTLMFSMAKHDIEEGHGLAFIDPHGDVSEDLLASVPLSRKDDLIYLNPWDLKYPIGINILELTPGLSEEDAELEKEVVCEGVISLFKKVFSKDENANAHRIEHILRNTIYTAFYVEDRTLFTINKLLTDNSFRKQIISKVDDEDLLNFWKSEFGKAGDFQIVKMTQGVTAKVGRFLRSPTARRMLEQTKSTINFDEILNGKILICNLSQGKLGEDTTKLIGTTILTKLQQAALKRANVSQSQRKPFYLYIDEFQNFATLSFIKIISEGRKYGLHLIIAEQSVSQQQDRSIVNQILANITTVVIFRSGNYLDEELMLDQFSPYLQKGEIPSLPRYHFYIKISALESEEPFSGETIYIPVNKDNKIIDQLIEASRKNWAIVYQKQIPQKITTTETNSDHKDDKKDKGNIVKPSSYLT